MTGSEETPMFPYCYCKNCNRLAPVRLYEALGVRECLVCAFVCHPQQNRLVWLSDIEAEIRGLSRFPTKER